MSTRHDPHQPAAHFLADLIEKIGESMNEGGPPGVIINVNGGSLTLAITAIPDPNEPHHYEITSRKIGE